MIANLRGKILYRSTEWIVLNVGGVGYEIYPTHADELAVNQEVELWIYTSVREDAIQLFGFENIQEREVFLALLKVSGIGPKLAVRILTAYAWYGLLNIINTGDSAALTAIPKVGRKTAEQILVELKGKTFAMPAMETSGGDGVIPALGHVRREITSALLHLGYRLPDIEKVVRMLPAHVELEQGVRESLQKLSQGV